MIVDIEKKAIERLTSGGLAVRDVEIQKGARGIVYPAVFVSTEAGKFVRIGQAACKLTVTLTVIIVFKHLTSEKDRRHGVYPVLEGVVNLLMLQTLGLEISPLIPVGFRNVTDEELADDKLMAYQLELETSFTLTRVDDEKATDLLQIGLQYFLQDPEDDQEADAEDLVDFEEE
jgi:hypothetical protein